MGAESQWDIQTALYTALTGNTALINLLANAGNGIFDYVPKQTKFPYVVIGNHIAKPFDTQQDQGMDVDVTFHIWSQYQGQKEVKAITTEIYNTLHDASFVVPNQNLVMIRLISTEVRQESDGVTYQAIQKFRILTEPL
jgi:hypothetical protein